LCTLASITTHSDDAVGGWGFAICQRAPLGIKEEDNKTEKKPFPFPLLLRCTDTHTVNTHAYSTHLDGLVGEHLHEGALDEVHHRHGGACRPPKRMTTGSQSLKISVPSRCVGRHQYEDRAGKLFGHPTPHHASHSYEVRRLFVTHSARTLWWKKCLGTLKPKKKGVTLHPRILSKKKKPNYWSTAKLRCCATCAHVRHQGGVAAEEIRTAKRRRARERVCV
jgi:hypothetical protein